MVLLIQREQTGVWHFSVLIYTDFFLSFKQKKRLEGGRGIHLEYQKYDFTATDTSCSTCGARVRMRKLTAILALQRTATCIRQTS